MAEIQPTAPGQEHVSEVIYDPTFTLFNAYVDEIAARFERQYGQRLGEEFLSHDLDARMRVNIAPMFFDEKLPSPVFAYPCFFDDTPEKGAKGVETNTNARGFIYHEGIHATDFARGLQMQPGLGIGNFRLKGRNLTTTLVNQWKGDHIRMLTGVLETRAYDDHLLYELKRVDYDPSRLTECARGAVEEYARQFKMLQGLKEKLNPKWVEFISFHLGERKIIPKEEGNALYLDIRSYWGKCFWGICTGNALKGFKATINMGYKVFHSKTFDKKLSKMGAEFLEWIDKVESQLSQNPYTGDPLGMKWFREKKRGKLRVYFLIYEKVSAVYMVAISDKKSQQKTINTIKLLVDVYKEEIERSIGFT